LNENRAWLYSVQQVVERLQPIVFEFGLTWFPGNINMAAEELEAAEFDWSLNNTSQLINLHETFLCLYDVRSKDHRNRDMRNKTLVEIAAKFGTTSE